MEQTRPKQMELTYTRLRNRHSNIAKGHSIISNALTAKFLNLCLTTNRQTDQRMAVQRLRTVCYVREERNVRVDIRNETSRGWWKVLYVRNAVDGKKVFSPGTCVNLIKKRFTCPNETERKRILTKIFRWFQCFFGLI